MNLDNSHFSRT